MLSYDNYVNCRICKSKRVKPFLYFIYLPGADEKMSLVTS